MPEQLTFDLPVRPALGREAYFVSPTNSEALAAIDAWESWPNRRHLLLGPRGSGKTHLAHVWAALSGAKILPAADLTSDAVPDLTGPIALEDLDQGMDEAALFHLLNLALAEGRPLLLTSTTPPTMTLPDLASRISAIPVARIAAPDDELLAAVLIKHFEDRQLVVNPKVIDYLIPRIERSFEAARTIAQALDQAALAKGRAVTVNVAAAVLEDHGDLDA